MLMKRKYSTALYVLWAVMATCFFDSCSKSKELSEDPYAGGKQVLDIQFESKSNELNAVKAGHQLELKVRGLMKYHDNFRFFVNEIETSVVSYTDSTLRFIVPEQASTGSVWIVAQDQTFFGPVIQVGGKVSVDETFKIVNGAGRLENQGLASVYDAEILPNAKFWLTGAFNTFELKGTEAKPNGGIVQVTADGVYDTGDGVNFGIGVVGADQAVYSINRINTGTQSGKYIIAGSFSAYNSKKVNRQTITNITRLNSNGTLDTIVTTDIVNPKPEQFWKNKDTIPSFNGGVDGFVRKTFIFGEQIYVIGGFRNYKRIYYPNSSYDEKVYDVARMRQLVRLNMDGSMDSTFHYNTVTNQSAAGANGGIVDAMMQTDGKLILVGNFTTFNGQMANRIVRLNLDGSVDPTFQTGTGANDDIYSIRYNTTTKKITVAGAFSSFDGKAQSGIAVLQADGKLDAGFVGRKISGGGVTFAGQLNNGKIIVTGTFNKYGDYVRQGFMILEANGQIDPAFNNTGGFQGEVYDMIETSANGGVKVMLVGNISRFNTRFPKNVLRIFIAN